MEKILVLGASGFLGKNFITYCRGNTNIQLTCISRGKPSYVAKQNNINWLTGDLNDNFFIEKILDFPWQQIINFYWEGLPDRNAELNRINFNNTKRLIDLISKRDVLLNNIGSGLEFRPSLTKIDDDSRDFAGDDFAMTKTSIHKYLVDSDIQFRWIRPFYVYGQWQNSKSLLASIVKAYVDKNEMIFRNPNLVHDFVSVYDFSDAFTKILLSEERMGSYNIGSGILTSVQTFARSVMLALSRDNTNSSIENFKNGICSSNLRISRQFNWKPKYIGAEGISSYVSDHREELINCFTTPL